MKNSNSFDCLSPWQRSFMDRYPFAEWRCDPFESSARSRVVDRLCLINSESPDDYYFVVYYFNGEYAYFPKGYGKKKSELVRDLTTEQMDEVIIKHGSGDK